MRFDKLVTQLEGRETQLSDVVLSCKVTMMSTTGTVLAFVSLIIIATLYRLSSPPNDLNQHPKYVLEVVGLFIEVVQKRPSTLAEI